MSHASESTHQPLEDLLTAVTEAIFADETALDSIIGRYHVPRAEVETWMRLIRRLHIALIGVRPSRRFVMRLRNDLMGQAQMNMLKRVRRLPPRVQIAAGVALLAVFMLLSRRRLAQYARQEVIGSEATTAV